MNVLQKNADFEEWGNYIEPDIQNPLILQYI